MKYLIIILLLLQFSIYGNYAVSKNVYNSRNKDSVSAIINLFEINIEINCSKRIFKKDSINQYNAYIEENNWSEFEIVFGKKANTENRIWNIVLYVNRFLEDGKTISIEDVEGYQVYFISEDNELHHRLYVKQYNDFDNFEFFNCESNALFADANIFFKNNIFNIYSRNNNGYSFVNLFSSHIHNYKSDVPVNKSILRLIKKYKKEHNIE